MLGCVGLAGHHLEEGWAGSGLVGWRGHRVEEARGQCGVEFGEAGRERVVLTGMPVAARRGSLDEIHDWGRPARREPDPVVGGGRSGECRVGFWFVGSGGIRRRGVGVGRGGDSGFAVLATLGLDGLVL